MKSIWDAQYENVHVYSGVCGRRRPRWARAFAQSDQDLRFSQTESLDTVERFNRKQIPGLDYAHVVWCKSAQFQHTHHENMPM